MATSIAYAIVVLNKQVEPSCKRRASLTSLSEATDCDEDAEAGTHEGASRTQVRLRNRRQEEKKEAHADVAVEWLVAVQAHTEGITQL